MNCQANAVLSDEKKRRLYDITNVLEGIDLVVKQSKNTVVWRFVFPPLGLWRVSTACGAAVPCRGRRQRYRYCASVKWQCVSCWHGCPAGSGLVSLPAARLERAGQMRTCLGFSRLSIGNCVTVSGSDTVGRWCRRAPPAHTATLGTTAMPVLCFSPGALLRR